MGEGKQIMTIGCLTVCFGVTMAITPENTNLVWGIFSGIMAAAGLPAIASGVKSVGKKVFS